ncbi:MAG: MmgE/PrpD family protein [Chloroflexi bacterium]|nr:MmgE/PrpD family protein [Chloroflexota bacterium]
MTVDARSCAGASTAPVDASLTERLAAFVSGTRATDVPDGVRENAAWWVLDWLGCAIAGLATQPGRILLEHSGAQPAAGCSCVGLVAGRSTQAAALHNGGVSHIVEMDDVDRASVIHPAAVVVPAALAVAEQRGASGRDLLAAVALGYEVAIRVGEAVGPSHYFHWHNTATCGVFGAAAAAGWLLGLDRQRLTWALGNAGTQAGGLWEFIADGAMSKHLHTGRAAANGVLAAELAALGFSGARTILEGRQGFFAATAPGGDPAAVTRALGQGWKLPGVSIKPYPSCRHTHSSVDAALWLRGEYGLSGAEVARVDIGAYHSVLDLTDNPAPAHLYAAKFSVQYCTARALVDGALRLTDFSDDRIAEAEVRDLMQRTSVRLDPALDARYPREFPAEVRLTLRDGRTVAATVGSPKGDPENPLSHQELTDKFLGMLPGTPYAGHADALAASITGLDTRPDVRGLVGLPSGRDGAQRTEHG